MAKSHELRSDIQRKEQVLAANIRRGIQFDNGANIYLRVAYSIVRCFLGPAFMESFKPGGFRHSDPSFLDNTGLVLLADYLFALRHSPGFDVLIDRFQERELRSPFQEARIAATVQRNSGTPVTIRQEIGKRGEDFDFHLDQHGARVNFEVTEIRGAFDKKKIKNKLHDKRDQFPADGPAVLYCIIPDDWILQSSHLYFDLIHETLKSYAGSRRVALVTYVWSEERPFGDGHTFIADAAFPVPNTEPRAPLPFPPETLLIKVSGRELMGIVAEVDLERFKQLDSDFSFESLMRSLM